jgi:hypothetical protein
MPARGSTGSAQLSLLVGAFVLASCSVYLDDLTEGRSDAASPEAGIGGRAGSGTGAAGAGGASGATGGAGSTGTGGVGTTAGSGGADLDASGGGGSGAGAGAGGSSGTGGASGASGASGGRGSDASAGAAGIAGSGGLGGAAGMDGSGGLGGTGGAGAQAGSAGSGLAGSAGTSGRGGMEAGTDTIIVLDSGANDLPRDAGDAGGQCDGSICKRVFVSSRPPPAGANLGGLTGADDFCQSAADTNQLGGTWKAWLSDPTTSASARLTHATVPYVLLDGHTVAANWSALTSGTLAHAIDVSEDGTVHTSDVLEVWTGTTFAGAYSGRSCGAWTSNAPGSTTADVGLSNQTNGNWTNRYQQYCDRTNVHLFCFEQ